MSPKPKAQGFGTTFARIWATFGRRSIKTSSKMRTRKNGTPTLFVFFCATDSHYHHETGFVLQLFVQVLIPNSTLPKSKNMEMDYLFEPKRSTGPNVNCLVPNVGKSGNVGDNLKMLGTS